MTIARLKRLKKLDTNSLRVTHYRQMAPHIKQSKHVHQVGKLTQGEETIVWKVVHSANGNPTDRQEMLPTALGWDCLNYHKISRQLLHSSPITDAVVASSLAVVRSLRGDLHSQLQQVLHITSSGDAFTVTKS